MRQRSARRLRRIAIATVIAMVPLAIMLIAMSDLLSTKPMAISLDYTPVVAIDQSSSTIGIADSELFNMSTTDIVATFDQMQSLGVNTVRVIVPWAAVQPVAPNAPNGAYRDWSKVDFIVQQATDRGMSVLGAINSTPLTWGSQPSGGLPFTAAPDPQSFANFAGEVAKRYGSNISAYEIWNEPNSALYWNPAVDPASYTQMLKLAYNAIKTANDVNGVVNPNDPMVVAGVFTSVIDYGSAFMSPVTFLDKMYQNGAKGYFDALSFHPYHFTTQFSAGINNGYPYEPIDQLIQMRQMMINKGDAALRIWATEYGLPTGGPNAVSDQKQAKFIDDFLRTWANLQNLYPSLGDFAGPSFIFTTRDRVLGAGTEDGSYGLYRWDVATAQWVEKGAAQVWDSVAQGWVMKSAVDIIRDFIAQYGNGELPPILNPGAQNPGAQNPLASAAGNPIAQLIAALQQMLNGFAQAFQSVFGSIQAAFGAVAEALVKTIVGIINPMSLSQQQAQVVQAASFAAVSSAGASLGEDTSGTEDMRSSTIDDLEAKGKVTEINSVDQVNEVNAEESGPVENDVVGAADVQGSETEESNGTNASGAEGTPAGSTEADPQIESTGNDTDNDTDKDAIKGNDDSGAVNGSTVTVESGSTTLAVQATGAESREPVRTGLVARPGEVGPDDSGGSSGSTTGSTTTGTTTGSTTSTSTDTGTAGGSGTGGSGSEHGAAASGGSGSGAGESGAGESATGGEGSGSAS
ncbi:cellulase family glycosylhydrolase [Mycobacterium sp. URHB0021]|jgi:polysaccharide biosynthesis protein PslG